MTKKSIRFFNDREVRAVWDEDRSKWWFSAIDIVRAINDEPDYVKAGNYWRWLKRKLIADGIQLVSTLTTSSSRPRMESSEHRTRWIRNAYRRWLSIIPTIGQMLFWTGSHIATIRLTARARKRPIPSLRAVCWKRWSQEPLNACSRFTPTSLAGYMILPGKSEQRISAREDSPLPMRYTFPRFFRQSKQCQKPPSRKLPTNMWR